MAALRPCPPGLVVRLSALSPRIVRPLRWRGRASLLNLRTSTSRTDHGHVIGARKGAGGGTSGLDPDDEKRLIEKQIMMFHDIFKKTYELKKDITFQEGIEKIDEYEKGMTSWNSSIFHIEARTFSLYLCMIAAIGVKLASKVMNSAGFRLDKKDGISSYTTKQNLMMYVSIFVKLAKDTYDKKFTDESIFSLLGAFKGVAAVGHILHQDALENVNYPAYSNNLMLDADNAWCDFEQKMNSLEEGFRAVSKSTKAYEILMPTIVNSMILAIFFISEVVARHKTVLGYVPEEQVKKFRELFAKHYDLKKDMPFREDIEKIDEFDTAMTSRNSSIFHIQATTFSLYFRMIATKGVKFASRVMESAALRHDKQDEMSLCTTKQTLTMYVSVFVKLVKDANEKKFNDESIFSIIGAFRGVAAIGHILLKGAIANVNYVGHRPAADILVQHADDTWREFEQKMDILEEKFRAVSKSTKAYQILRPTMTHAMKHTMFFISAMVATHERVLGYVPGTKGRRKIDGEPGALGTTDKFRFLIWMPLKEV